MSLAEDDAPREQGRVVSWSEFERFGFASRDADPRGRQVFVHINAVDGQCRLTPATPVEFVVTKTEKGLRALRVSALTRRANG